MYCDELNLEVSPELSRYVNAVFGSVDGSAFEKLSNALQKLRTEFDTVLYAVRDQINNLAPIHRLPDDALSLVFRCNLASFPIPCDTPRDSMVMDPPAPQVISSHVCRRWRRIILSDVECWTDIHINPFHMHNIMALATLLERTKLRGVKLKLNPRRSGARLMQDFDMIRGLVLQQHMSHFESLALPLASIGDEIEIFSYYAPRLRDLHITGIPETPRHLPSPFLPMSPHLERLSLTHVIIPSYEWKFSNLKDLYLSTSRVPFGLAHIILSTSPVLRCLHLDAQVNEVRTTETPDPTVQHTFLKSLILSTFDEAYLLDTMRHACIDRLDTLDLTCSSTSFPQFLLATALLPLAEMPEILSISTLSTRGRVEIKGPGNRFRAVAMPIRVPEFITALRDLPLALANVTTLAWRLDQWQHLQTYFANVPNLLDLSVSFHDIITPPTFARAPISCPRLRSLTLIFELPDEAHPLILAYPNDVSFFTTFIDDGLSFGSPRLERLILVRMLPGKDFLYELYKVATEITLGTGGW